MNELDKDMNTELEITGIVIQCSETPEVYHYQNRTKQKKGMEQPHLYRTFWSEKGSVTIQNKFISVTVLADGGVSIEPHQQLLGKHDDKKTK